MSADLGAKQKDQNKRYGRREEIMGPPATHITIFARKELVEIFDKIEKEYERALELHPNWPEDEIHAVSIMIEEAGESLRAANRFIMEDGDYNRIAEEVVQTAAMCLRILTNLYEIK